MGRYWLHAVRVIAAIASSAAIVTFVSRLHDTSLYETSSKYLLNFYLVCWVAVMPRHRHFFHNQYPFDAPSALPALHIHHSMLWCTKAVGMLCAQDLDSLTAGKNFLHAFGHNSVWLTIIILIASWIVSKYGSIQLDYIENVELQRFNRSIAACNLLTSSRSHSHIISTV